MSGGRFLPCIRVTKGGGGLINLIVISLVYIITNFNSRLTVTFNTLL